MRLRQAIWAMVAAAIVFATSAGAAPARVAAATTAPCTSAQMSPNVPYTAPTVPGLPILFTASATTCASPGFEFFLQKPGGPWLEQTTYGGATWTWDTTGFPAGIYWVRVWARDTGSSAQYEADWSGTFTLLGYRCEAASISTVEMTQTHITPGASIHFSFSAGPCSSMQSRVWLKKPGGAWAMVRNYGANTWTWNTKGYRNGTYLVGVWVRRPGSTRTYEGYAIATYYLGDTPNCSMGLTLSATPGSAVLPGTVVQLNAWDPVCRGLFEFWIKRPGADWTVLARYSSNYIINWDTTGAPSGTYQLGVWEKLPGWKPAYLSYNIITFQVDVGECGVALLNGAASPQLPGSKIPLNFGADCPFPEYEVWLQPSPTAAWVVLQPYGPGNSYTLDTTGAPPGQIRIGIWVRESGSPIRYDTYAIMSFWLGS